MRKFDLGIAPLLKQVLAVISMDGGFVIGVQTVTFLICYFSLGGKVLLETDNLRLFTFIAILLLHIINVSIIIIRISGLNRGLKFPFVVCYQQAMRHLPGLLSLILCLYLLLTLILPTPILRFVATLLFLPFFIVASSHIIDQNLNWLKAIIATLKFINQKLDYRLALCLMLSYGATLSLGILCAQTDFAPYLMLVMELLLLFCHVMAITIYTQCYPPQNKTSDPNTKVILA